MKKDFALSLTTGISLTLAFPPFKFGFLAYVALIPFFLLLEDKTLKDSFRWGYVFGLFSCLGILFWIAEVTLPGAISAILFLPLYFSLYAVLHSLMRSKLGDSYKLFIPFLWTGIEYLKSLGQIGFPWMSLGHTQSYYLFLIQHASITSVFGVSFWVVVLNVLFYQTWQHRNNVRQSIISLAIAVAVFLVPSVHGFVELSKKKVNSSEIRVALVQGNIDPFLKWKFEFKNQNFSTYERLTKVAQDRQPDLIVWPETAVPSYLLHDPPYLRRIRNIVDSANVPLLTGSMDYIYNKRNDEEYFNSAILVQPHEKTIERYAKMQLVPFGERVPFEDSFPFSQIKKTLSKFELGEGDFSRGKSLTTFSLHKKLDGKSLTRVQGKNNSDGPLKFATVICYESIFPDLVRKFVSKGAKFLVVITNDAWFGKTTAPFQHAQFAVFRAIENRISIARCANTGISMFIDPYGRIQKSTKWFEEAVIVDDLILRDRQTFYSRHGSIIPFLITVFNIIPIGYALFKNWLPIKSRR